MTGTRTPLWQHISSTLTDDITTGRYKPGDKIPTEAQLAARFGVNRHTVRHALKDMADAGLILSRRGAGVFVTQTPTDYPLGRRVRFHQNIRAAGRLPAKRIVTRETRAADAEETAALRIKPGTLVHAVEGLSLADDTPLAWFRSVFPLTRLPQIDTALASARSITEALSACGITDYTRASTRISATRASPSIALHLRCREGDPVLHTASVNVDATGTPVESGLTWYAADRVTLTLDQEDLDTA
ncbi:phosphonate metabolism transcriptional regulator PhnF [Pseudooceanicola onchidii]|uniref:phosphonate metabolism transcriptional regulator PhnF n=1 Tax=Pseudooceanicola onchidii TaxID=2562279 RepID=UPI0010A9DC68|nr:phosphonate metabolism transcriptional regulator PhnF [Pseudooceanicola onchidii]